MGSIGSKVVYRVLLGSTGVLFGSTGVHWRTIEVSGGSSVIPGVYGPHYGVLWEFYRFSMGIPIGKATY